MKDNTKKVWRRECILGELHHKIMHILHSKPINKEWNHLTLSGINFVHSKTSKRNSLHTEVSILSGTVSSLYKTVNGWKNMLEIIDILQNL